MSESTNSGTASPATSPTATSTEMGCSAKLKPVPIGATWWKYFNTKVKRYLFASGLLSVAALGLAFLCTHLLVTQGVYYDVPLQSTSTLNIGIVTRIASIDVTDGTVTADWYPLHLNCSSPDAKSVVNIFFDPNLLQGLDGKDDPEVSSDSQPSKPIFRLNTTRCHGTVKDSMATFRTVSKLVDVASDSRWTGSSLQFYPRDKYFVQLSLFAQLDSSNSSVGIVTLEPAGSPVNFDVKLNQQKSRNTQEGLFIRLDISRSMAVRLAVFFIIAANWLLSLVFLWIAVASLLWHEDVVKELFVVPVATLFTIISVRTNMPGAPAGFGAIIDFVGIWPNTVIMTFASTILLIVVLSRRIHHQETDLESKGQTGDEFRAALNALDAASKVVAAASDALIAANKALAAAHSQPNAVNETANPSPPPPDPTSSPDAGTVRFSDQKNIDTPYDRSVVGLPRSP